MIELRQKIPQIPKDALKSSLALIAIIGGSFGAGKLYLDTEMSSKSQIEANKIALYLNSKDPVTGKEKIEEGFRLPLPNQPNRYDWNPIILGKNTYGRLLISSLGKVSVDSITYTKALQPSPVAIGPNDTPFRGEVNTPLELVNSGTKTDPNYLVVPGDEPSHYSNTSQLPAIATTVPFVTP